MKNIVQDSIRVAVVSFSILTGVSAHALPVFTMEKTPAPCGMTENPVAGKGVAFVRVGARSGYYVVSSSIPGAPYSSSDNAARSGVGLDSIAFCFGPDGKLAGFPVYMTQLAPDSYYTNRLQGVAPGNATLKLVRELFAGETLRVETRGTHTTAYLEVSVYNPRSSGS